MQFHRNDYFTDPAMAVPRRFFATTGQSYSREGVNYSEDLNQAARNAQDCISVAPDTVQISTIRLQHHHCAICPRMMR